MSAIQGSIAALKQVAIDEGIYNANAPLYPNYAPPSATAQQLYTPEGAATLQAIRKAYDPALVGDLTGGFTI